jgi:hypothetical protein
MMNFEHKAIEIIKVSIVVSCINNSALPRAVKEA